MRSFIHRFGALIGLLLLPLSVLAGTPADPEFAPIATKITNWATGNLAIAVSIGALIVGAVIGLARVTAMPALTAVVFALIFSIGAGLVTGIIGAVI